MKTISICLILWMAGHGRSDAAPLVKNSDFAKRAGDESTLPANWRVPEGSPWKNTNEDGHSGQDSLRYRSRKAIKAGPVSQAITLPANAECLLVAWVKIEGALQPLVRLRNSRKGGSEIIRLTPENRLGQWTSFAARFNSGAITSAVIELWADTRHVQNQAAPSGTAAFDDVNVLLASEADQLLKSGPNATAWQNLARGKPYTLSPNPGYSYCTEVGDKTQLTDGQYTVGYFWTQKSTVGWSRSRPIIITLDLEREEPIRGISYNTAAGVARVEWPASITLLVSLDGRVYHSLGDLVELSRKNDPAPEKGYAIHRFHTESLQTHGRYVKLLVDPAGAYCFVDEIEVLRGEDAWKQVPLPGKAIRYPLEYFKANMFNAAVRRRIGRDLEKARSAVEQAKLAGPLNRQLRAEVEAVEKAIGELPEIDSKGFQAVFPLNEIHARVFALHGAVRAAAGLPPIVAWKANPWDFLTTIELPEDRQPAAVSLAAMRGETRAGAVNLVNCTEKRITLELRFEGIPGSPRPADLAVHEVAWTDTREGVPVAAALPRAKTEGDAYRIALPAGLTRQLWFSFKPARLPAGLHRGAIVLSGASPTPTKVPISLQVFGLDFPKQPALHLGGWDYTNSPRMYGVTPENRLAVIAHLRSRYVDSPWATRGAMSFGSYDNQGNLSKAPDTGNFDSWVDLWHGARRYCVFNAVGNNVAGTKIGHPLFEKKVAAWIHFWVKHARSRGILPEQLCLLLVDEPHDNSQDATIVAWAKAVKAAEPEVVIWEDPTYRIPKLATSDLMSAADVLCPNRPMMMTQGKAFKTYYLEQKKAGRRLELYSCSGPARLLDPYTYHRLQAWTCFEIGAESSYFWAFADTGGGDSWNEYMNMRTSYTPFFVGPDSVTPGKHMEAIRESVEDFEYLVMLRDRVAVLEKRKTRHPLLPKAKALLSAAVNRVLDAKGADDLGWRAEKNRSLADTVRIEIGNLLERLQ